MSSCDEHQLREKENKTNFVGRSQSFHGKAAKKLRKLNGRSKNEEESIYADIEVKKKKQQHEETSLLDFSGSLVYEESVRSGAKSILLTEDNLTLEPDYYCR